MEVKEEEKIVIAKPVASRPTSSSCRSFSELLTSAINASASAACSHPVTAIRPKTLRFKPVVDYASAAAVSFQGASGSIYQQELAELEAHFEQPKGVMSQPKLASELYLDSPSQSDGKQLMECSKLISENLDEDEKNLLHTNTVDRLSYDEYNWRKYGQKQVKGSEYPRSYYKCTHPGCPVKKMVESSLDGQIAEIVYKGEHNHSKPEPLKRSSSDRQGQGFVSDTTCSETNNPPWNVQLSERNENCKTENQNDAGSSGHSTHSSSAPPFCDPMMTAAFHAGAHVAGTNCGLSEECDEGSKYLEAEVDGPKGKRRRNGNQLNERCISGEGTKEPCIIVQNPSDSDSLGDGFHWRKYGQKVVKGNPYPRSYYRCTSVQCNVRKYVERTSDVLGAFVTTYEGKHNHDMPIKSTNLVASKMNMKIVSTKEQL